jgi:drug/metabolite transporter (DMT)-like permease
MEYNTYRREMTPWGLLGIIGTMAGIMLMRKGRRHNNWLFGGGIMLTSQSLILTWAVGTAILWAKRALRRHTSQLEG